MKFVTILFNATIRQGSFLNNRILPKIIVILKPRKPSEERNGQSVFLCVLSKIFEKIFRKTMTPILPNKTVIPDYQFGFKQQHSTF